MLSKLCRLPLVLVFVLLGSTSVASAAPGDLDATFGDGGLVTISDFATPTRAGRMALQPDGKIVTVGETVSEDWAISRFNSDGTPDTSFSGDGLQTLDMGGSESAADVAIQPDGKLVVIGWASVGGRDVFAVARYTTDGTLDNSFSGDGIQTTDFGADATASDVQLQSDGKIVVVGQVFGNVGLARYLADGTLDPSFGTGGIQTTDLGNNEGATAVAIQDDGKIVVTSLAAEFTEEPDDFLVLRYTADGALDSSFSGDGVQITTWDDDSDALDVAVQPDGKIVVIGDVYSDASGNFDFGVVRYLPNGTPDVSFSGDGQSSVNFGDDSDDFPTAMALQADGRIVIAGGALDIDHIFALARLNPDGALDPDFSGDGRVTTVFAGSAHVYGVAVQSDGKIVAAGNLIPDVPGNDQLAMARYEGGGGATPPDAPTNNVLPEIFSGEPVVGSTLSATVGDWSGTAPIDYAFQWLRDGLPIVGATGSSYVVTASDQGHALAVMVTATNLSGNASATSAPLSIPAPVPPTEGGQQPPGGGTPTPSPKPGLHLAKLVSIAATTKDVGVRVYCPVGDSTLCTRVKVTLSVQEQLRGGTVVAVSAKKQRRSTKRVVVGSTSLAPFPGAYGYITLGLNRTGRKLAKRFGKLKVTVRVASGGKLLGQRVVGLGQSVGANRRTS